MWQGLVNYVGTFILEQIGKFCDPGGIPFEHFLKTFQTLKQTFDYQFTYAL